MAEDSRPANEPSRLLPSRLPSPVKLDPSGSPLASGRRRQHLLDRPALATPLQQGLDLDAGPLRPRRDREGLTVPGEQLAAVVPLCGRVIAGRSGTRQVPRPVVPSPLRVPTQRQVGRSLQRGSELLVADGPIAGRTVRPGTSLVGHIGPSSASSPRTPRRRRGRVPDPWSSSPPPTARARASAARSLPVTV